MAHSYSWIATSGYWNTSSNWNDLTILKNPALVAPGGSDTVTIAGAAFPGIYAIAGPGAAAQTNFSGGLALFGPVNLGTVRDVTPPTERSTSSPARPC